jgi:hypothetical protein
MSISSHGKSGVPPEAELSWDRDSVIAQLRVDLGPDGRTKAQVFLDTRVMGDLPVIAQHMVDAARNASGDQDATLGKVHRLARSFGVSGSVDLVAEISRLPGVKAVLPARIDDIYPKSLDIRPL